MISCGRLVLWVGSNADKFTIQAALKIKHKKARNGFLKFGIFSKEEIEDKIDPKEIKSKQR